MALIEFTESGMYCPQADVFIDPWRAVNKALITHGHSDHARYGSAAYFTHHQNVPIIKRRLGNIEVTGFNYDESILINGVAFSFHPAGHVVGSSQIRVEHKGEVWVASGDYKTEADGVCQPFEPVKCHTFITESTFGLPVFNWNSQQEVMEEINQWWQSNADNGKASVIFAYSLGKAQRILCNINHRIGPVYVHGAVADMNEACAIAGVQLPPYQKVVAAIAKEDYKTALIIAPASANNPTWMKKFEPCSTAVASGWMALRGARRWQAADKGFVLSDHADWPSLNRAVQETGAEQIIATHGYTQAFANWLTEKGYNGRVVQTGFTGEQMKQEEEVQSI
ncbi:MAG: ligase-associated DNA damage response exonuclease [Bacteroidota bacterium]|jgi:putative mRNA 3-end processing factor|nr:ligase-associated DNA damage response exonuclease [Sphingobacteriales bacterium]